MFLHGVVLAIAHTETDEVPPRAQLTIRIDLEVLDWFRKQGGATRTRINALSRRYMEAYKKDVAELPHGTKRAIEC